MPSLWLLILCAAEKRFPVSGSVYDTDALSCGGDGSDDYNDRCKSGLERQKAGKKERLNVR